MYHILLELPSEPQPNEYPLTLEESLTDGLWAVKDRHGITLGDGHLVELGADRLPDSWVSTTIRRPE